MPQKGMLLVYTGDGKGKTTAALGLALRASGYGMKVGIIQFMKGTWNTGEMEALKKIKGIDLIRTGKGFYKILDDRFTEKEHRNAAKLAIQRIQKCINQKKYDILILDEINVTVDTGLLKTSEVLNILQKIPPNLHVILTGRNAPAEFIEIADLVTEMKEIKHPYQKGGLAQKGLDY
jgi:cob(I)alamin adenosyltransferase